MRLIENLEQALAAESSLFRAQLLREDIVRLKKLEDLAASAPDADAFVKAGLRLGWTQGDARTAEIREPLEAFLRASLAGDDALIARTWEELHRARLERLLGCLSTPVPKPAR
jgi:5-carboxymethyl-2-hydroxymuconate isomerase